MVNVLRPHPTRPHPPFYPELNFSGDESSRFQFFVFYFTLLATGEMLADSTVTVSGLTSPSGHPPPFLLPPPRALMMNPAAYLAAPFLYGNSALRYKLTIFGNPVFVPIQRVI